MSWTCREELMSEEVGVAVVEEVERMVVEEAGMLGSAGSGGEGAE